MLSAPSAFTYLTGQAHWSLLLRARALDSQCIMIGAAQGEINLSDGHGRHGDMPSRYDGTVLSNDGGELQKTSALKPALCHGDGVFRQIATAARTTKTADF